MNPGQAQMSSGYGSSIFNVHAYKHYEYKPKTVYVFFLLLASVGYILQAVMI